MIFLHKDIDIALCHAPRVDGDTLKLANAGTPGQSQVARVNMDYAITNRPLYYDGQHFRAYALNPNTLLIANSASMLVSSTVTTADSQVIRGISAYGTDMEDLAAIAHIAGVVAADGDSLFVMPGKSLDITGSLRLSGSPVTATAAELNKLDGCLSTTAELNMLSSVLPGKVQGGRAIIPDQENSLDDGAGSQFNLVDLRLEGILYADRIIANEINNVGGDLNADTLNGLAPSYYLNVDNVNAGILAASRGGLGNATWANRQLPAYNAATSRFEPSDAIIVDPSGNVTIDGDFEVTGEIRKPLIWQHARGKLVRIGGHTRGGGNFLNKLTGTELQMEVNEDVRMEDGAVVEGYYYSAMTLPVAGYYEITTVAEVTCTGNSTNSINAIMSQGNLWELRNVAIGPTQDGGNIAAHTILGSVSESLRTLMIGGSGEVSVNQKTSQSMSLIYKCEEVGTRILPTYIGNESDITSFEADIWIDFTVTYIGGLHS